ncbi:hypothetical protein EIN_172950 [Entamoeba invadens IP1]|uniref:TLDc domain-containing protein n=1 Tax=Entamoeba invadens IP1 TaxID=370355 RepID=A0A0A1TYK5_ENTIV|nr:hypothetical protein EIN_172950 [Entamoeba invadens IP1]ELP84640.1 hypothetical protein EIN_172950 [Entamoeba invadens IP1]|eukprot:XP_004183986.1 hypothetical protein EIN_172950 [Entamoeba invadens IP1]
MGNRLSESSQIRTTQRSGSLSNSPEIFLSSPLGSFFSPRSPRKSKSSKHFEETLDPESITKSNGLSKSTSEERISFSKGKKAKKDHKRKNSTPKWSFFNKKEEENSLDEVVLEKNPLFAFILSKTLSQNIESVFDSNVSGFDARELRQKIACKENLVFVIQTEFDYIGFYQSDIVPPMKQNTSYQAKSEEMFLFSMKKESKNIEIYARKDWRKNTFNLFTDDNKTFFACFSAFWVDKNGKVNINPCAKDAYDITPSFNPFFENCSIEKRSCIRMTVLHCF